MPYYQLFYHLVWSTKNRQPLLTGDVEPLIYGFLRAKAIGLGATVFALGGVEDHVHLVASIPPGIAVARFVGQIKAVASTKFNKSQVGGQPFFWQDEYGAFSFDGKRLPNYIAYVTRQKQHHAQNAVLPILERTSEGAPKFMREDAAPYTVEDATWLYEMGGIE